MLKLLVGLGNPGSKYEKTRHNAGFLFLDKLAERYNGRWSLESKFQGLLSQVEFQGNKLLLLKPQTFMNLSGISVGCAMNYYKVSPEEVLVVHDELDLPESIIKLKRDGGHAGHNGVRSVISHIGTRDFYRLRVGIGRPATGIDVAGYVLASPSSEAQQELASAIDNACNHLADLLQGDPGKLNGELVAQGGRKRVDKK